MNQIVLYFDDEMWGMLNEYADYFCEPVERVVKSIFYTGVYSFKQFHGLE